MKPIYFDYAATTPVATEVQKAMQPWWGTEFGNPGSLHLFGQHASAAVFKFRQDIAKAIGARYDEVIFTGSATEANNIALRGAVSIWKKKYSDKPPRIIISAFEHDCINETAKQLASEGVEVVRISVSADGVVVLEELKKALTENTVLVSVMYVNNEVGTIQPIEKIKEMIAEFKLQHSKSAQEYPLLHTDAVQAFQYFDCNVDMLGVDMLTLSAHKIYGPKGVGALYIRKSKEERMRSQKGSALVMPIIFGGGQEKGMRSGTENVPAIVGFAKAVSLAVGRRDKEKKRVQKLTQSFLKGLMRLFPKMQVNGSLTQRTPNNLNVYIPSIHGEQFLVQLDLLGIAASSGAACSARALEASRTLTAMGFDEKRSKNSIRFTFGRYTTSAEVRYALKVIAKVQKSALL